MAGYRRFVAYVYEYTNNQKGSSRGFIKVEARNGICKMNFHLRGNGTICSLPCKIYGFVREGKRCKAIFLGTCNMAKEEVECILETKENSMGNTRYSLGELAGILILGEENSMYATQWDDIPIRMEDFEWENREDKTSEQLNAPVEPSNENNSSKIEEISSVRERARQGQEVTESAKPARGETGEQSGTMNHDEQEKTEENGVQAELTTEEVKEEKRERIEEQTEQEDKGEIEKESAGNTQEEGNNVEKEVDSAAKVEQLEGEELIDGQELPEEGEQPEKGEQPEEAEKLDGGEELEESEVRTESRQLDPQEDPSDFQPFSDSDIIMCRKITPRELGMSNSFLLHGYHNYRHLLLGKIRNRNQYILGIPGLYDQQERFMAGMFGFPNFKPARNLDGVVVAQTNGNGTRAQFGYWYRLIDSPDFYKRNGF